MRFDWLTNFSKELWRYT